MCANLENVEGPNLNKTINSYQNVVQMLTKQ